VQCLRTATDHVLSFDDADDRRAVATPYLELAATTVAAVLLARQVLVTADRDDGSDELALRAFVLERLPVARGLLPVVGRGADLLRRRGLSPATAGSSGRE
jgi:uncharacterized membrane-anchored protein